MKKLVQIILAVAIVGLIYVIYVQISTPIRFDQEMKTKKAQVIDRIKDIRTAQRAFKSKYQHFTGSFDSLTAFVLTDTLEMERKIVDEDDSVAMAMLKKSGKKNIEKFKVAVIDGKRNMRPSRRLTAKSCGRSRKNSATGPGSLPRCSIRRTMRPEPYGCAAARNCYI